MNSQDTSPKPDANSEKGRSRPSLRGRLWKWVDRRTGADKILHQSLDEPIPGGARFAYVFGSALLFILISQVVTGLCLALYYAPSPITAHASVAYIVKEVAAGAFLRSLHSYGSSAMLVVLLLHFLQTFLYGSYKGKREILWISGCTLSLLVMGMAFTGYLLSWDQRAYSAGSVGTDIVGQVPLIGESLRLLLRGGATMGALTLSRFYVLHIFIIPALIFSFIAMHMFLFRKAGAAGPVNEDPVRPQLPTEMFYPKQVLIDMGFVLLVMGFLGMLAHFFPVTLGLQADPSNTSYLPRPEWYYLPMFQWLKYWEGWRTVIGVFIIPVILIGLFFLLPFMDRGLERRPWRRPIPVGGVFIVLIGLLWLGMSSRLDDSRDPTVAAQLAEQNQQEEVYFHSAFQPYSASSPAGGETSTALDLSAAQGKGIFDSHGCSGCHGASGGGAIGPALTHISSKFPPDQLAALLKAPTAKMKSAGMVPLTLNTADMTALVSYLTSLGGTSAAGSPATAPASGSAPPASPASSNAAPGATAVPSNAGAVATAHASGTPSPAPAKAKPGVVAGSSNAGTGSSAVTPAAARGKGIFKSQRCSGCHGMTGGGGVGPALTHISSKFQPAQLTALLKAPTARMKAAGMVPLTLKSADMKALVSYLSSLGGTPAASAAAPPASGSSPPASPAAANAETAVETAPSNAGTGTSPVNASATPGKGIYDSNRCGGCHGASGGGGAGPALTHISSQYQPAQLEALLKAPTAKMKAAGMVSLTLNDTDMKALVSFVTSLGGAPAASAATTPASGSAPPAPAKAEPGAAAGPATAASAATSPASGPSPTATAVPPMNKLESKGNLVFKAHRCADCHGTDGVAGTAAARALAGAGARLAPAPLTTMLQHPTAQMQQGGMPPVSLSGDDLKALVAYVSYISGSKGSPTK